MKTFHEFSKNTHPSMYIGGKPRVPVGDMT